MPNRRRVKKRQTNEGALGTNKRRAGLSPLLRVDETMRQGLSTFDGVDETVAHGLSPGEWFDETGAVASYKCINNMMLAFFSNSFITALRRSSNCPLYLVPATSEARSKVTTRLL